MPIVSANQQQFHQHHQVQQQQQQQQYQRPRPNEGKNMFAAGNVAHEPAHDHTLQQSSAVDQLPLCPPGDLLSVSQSHCTPSLLEKVDDAGFDNRNNTHQQPPPHQPLSSYNRLPSVLEPESESTSVMSAPSSTPPPPKLKIIAARYGWAEDLWKPTVLDNTTGSKDVTDITRMLVLNSKLHINPECQPQWMNTVFWPEQTLWPPISRIFSVMFQLGDGPIEVATTPRVAYERVDLLLEAPQECPSYDQSTSPSKAENQSTSKAETEVLAALKQKKQIEGGPSQWTVASNLTPSVVGLYYYASEYAKKWPAGHIDPNHYEQQTFTTNVQTGEKETRTIDIDDETLKKLRKNKNIADHVEHHQKTVVTKPTSSMWNLAYVDSESGQLEDEDGVTAAAAGPETPTGPMEVNGPIPKAISLMMKDALHYPALAEMDICAFIPFGSLAEISDSATLVTSPQPSQYLFKAMVGQLPTNRIDVSATKLAFIFYIVGQCGLHLSVPAGTRLQRLQVDDKRTRNTNKKQNFRIAFFDSEEEMQDVRARLHKRILIDHIGVWYARNSEETALLDAWLSNDETRPRNSPKSCMSVEILPGDSGHPPRRIIEFDPDTVDLID